MKPSAAELNSSAALAFPRCSAQLGTPYGVILLATFNRVALLHRFSPLHCPPLAAALVGQHHRTHGSQSLLRRYVERGFLLNGVAHVRIETAIISPLGFYFHAGLAHQSECAPQLFRFHSPIRTPIQS